MHSLYARFVLWLIRPALKRHARVQPLTLIEIKNIAKREVRNSAALRRPPKPGAPNA